MVLSEAVDPGAGEEVVVTGSKSPFVVDSRALRRAAKAFDKDRSLAPQAPLRFRVIDYTPKGEALRIWIERGDAVETLEVGADGLLTLPEAAFADGARLLANRSDKALKMFAEILSPGTTLRTRRLGDLRLQCRVELSFNIGGAPIYIRAVMPPVGVVCNSRNFGFYAYTGFTANSAEIRGGSVSGRARVAVGNLYDGGYAAPLGDRSISDDAIIELK
jgi:hypothetical protein